MRQGVYSAPKYFNNYASPANKKWPQDIQCIIKSHDPSKGSLYLSNVQAAQNPATVKKLNVGAILSCAKGYMLSHSKTLVPHYMYIPGEDKQTFDISLHFDEAVNFIQKALQKTNIIVHCIAGVSRSVSMVIAYFMKCKQLTYNEAFYEVKSKRKIISPNEGFIQHLKKYEQKLKELTFSPVKKQQLNNQGGKIRRQEDEDIQYFKLKSKQFYTPKKGIQYYKSIQLQNTVKNPQLSPKDNMTSMKLSSYESTALYSPNRYSTNKNDNIYSYKEFAHSTKLYPQNNNSNVSIHKSNSNSNNIIKFNSYQSQVYSPHKQENVSIKNKINERNQLIYGKNKSGSGYFDSMNKQLNQKIQQIRKKYQQQRVQMMKSYSSRGYSAQKQRSQNVYTEKQKQIPLSRNYTNNQRYENHFSPDLKLQRNYTNNLQFAKTSGSFNTLDSYKNRKNISPSPQEKRNYQNYDSRNSLYEKKISYLDKNINLFEKTLNYKYNTRIKNLDNVYVPRIINVSYTLPYSYGKRYY